MNIERVNEINDEERRQWVLNDEGLYRSQRASKLSLQAFIRSNRTLIDAAINKMVSGKKPAHFLVYGG